MSKDRNRLDRLEDEAAAAELISNLSNDVLTRQKNRQKAARANALADRLRDQHPSTRTDWSAGQRVSRTDTGERGIIVEVDGQIKVKWDNGRTSYYPNHSTAIKIQPDQ